MENICTPAVTIGLPVHVEAVYCLKGQQEYLYPAWFTCTAGNTVSLTLTLVNDGNVKLQAVVLEIVESFTHASLGTTTCVVDSAPWSTGDDLAVDQQLVCSSSFTLDQETLETGGVSPIVIVSASHLAQLTMDLPPITFINTPSLAVTVDVASCSAPSRAGTRT